MTLEDRGSIAYTGDNAASVWYLAYGSNLNATKFLHDRQITPISQVNVEIPGWVLTLDSAGVPYSEPSFASMSVCSGRFVAGEKVPCLVGIAYELTRDMYRKVIASEGGGIAYAEVEVRAKRIDPMCASNSTPIETFAVRGLVTLMPRAASPSQRYMELVRTGASEACLPKRYQDYLSTIPIYHPPTKYRQIIGAKLFLGFWIPVMSFMEVITKTFLKENDTAYVPLWITVLVRCAVYAMWWHHDYIHAPIWGRGDGLFT